MGESILKVGIMGGTFDPIHIGHLLAAEHAAEQAKLDEVWFIPSYQPPHKSAAPRATDQDRWNMVNLAISGHPKFRAVDWEIRKGGVSYSLETAKMLVAAYPEHEFYWLIGADMVQYLPHWHRIEELCSLVSFIGFARPGTRIDLGALEPVIRNRVRLVDIPQFDISSTYIRERLRGGRSVRYLVPDSVLSYIEERRLYE
jgi:nicotinate-nucleotide adenylyltransferase